ncbi:hypothetical protein IMSAG025_00146 [Muribaculaceae bacterium]|nr:hypothetical protein IMSAG025_00146 [Muribaculaceae bacterium]
MVIRLFINDAEILAEQSFAVILALPIFAFISALFTMAPKLSAMPLPGFAFMEPLRTSPPPIVIFTVSRFPESAADAALAFISKGAAEEMSVKEFFPDSLSFPDISAEEMSRSYPLECR